MLRNGIDLVEISRIEKSMENPKFIEKLLGKEEFEELNRRKMPVQSVAGAFAAKEAFSKSLGSGIKGFDWNEVEVLHDESGCPYFKLTGNALSIASEKKLNFALSITHTAQYAAAMVTAYTEE